MLSCFLIPHNSIHSLTVHLVIGLLPGKKGFEAVEIAVKTCSRYRLFGAKVRASLTKRLPNG
jgi:uncharacterized membrane protein